MLEIEYRLIILEINLFNENILISGFAVRIFDFTLVEINSFSIIPYDFTNQKRKVPINVEKLYLIEWVANGSIYKSEDEYHWKKVSTSGKLSEFYSQMYCLYNKENLYFTGISLLLVWYKEKSSASN